MRKFFLTSFFILTLFVIGSVTMLYVFPERTQNYLIDTFNLKKILNNKFKTFITQKINDENINVNIEKINFLKPFWPNIVKIELSNIDVTSKKQASKSNIKFIELGFTFEKLIENFFSNENIIKFSYINLKDLTLNAKIEKNKFIAGPLVKIFSSINQNNFDTQPALKKIFQSKIEIGKINLSLTYERNLLNRKVLEVKCENVLISEYIHKSRSLYMECKEGKKDLLLIKGDIAENSNTFTGEFKNFDPNLLLNNWFDKNFNFLNFDIKSKLNGSYNVKTNKNFVIQSVRFVSDESILISNDKVNKETYKTKVNGVLSWEKKNNLLKYSDLFLGDKLVAFGQYDLTTKHGFSNFSVKKILVDETKIYLSKFLGSNYLQSSPSFIKNFNNIRSGNLRKLSFNIKFSLFEKLIVHEITGLSNFSNIRFEYNNKIFKKILSTLSGDFKFTLKPQELTENFINFNIKANKGFLLLNDIKFQYKFNHASITGVIDNNNLLINKADFLKNKKLEYSFNNVIIKKNNFTISKLKHFKDNNLIYTLNHANISNMRITKGSLRVNSSPELSNFIKREFNIEMIGDIDFDVILSGDLKKQNFNLKLQSDLKNSYLKIDYLDLIKKNNITSFMKSEVSLIGGKISSFKDTILTVKDNIYKISLIKFKKEKISEVLLTNVETPNLVVDKLLFSKIGKNLKIQASGKKIDLSNLNKKIQNQTKRKKEINLDLTADLIKLNSKISLTGNLNGKIKNSSFRSIAYGKISLGDSPILDNGKFNIYVDNQISTLKGLGLVGGAETKIDLQKKTNRFASLVFNTSNGGKLLNALGFTKNIKSGEMDINIDFLNDDYNHYKGHIRSKKFSLVNAPGIINSLSVLSFSGITSIISGEGVFFERGKTNIIVKNKIFYFDKLYLSSDSLGIAAKGKLDLEKKSIDLRGSVAPIKLISKIISVVPAIGELLTGLKKEGLFAGQFKMVGLLENPEIQLNKMSFAPGIFRDIFSEDWLDKNNFFVNGETN